MTFSDIASFLGQIIKRFVAPSPTFFKVVKYISVAVALITGLPAFLQENGIVLPEAIEVISSKVIMWAGVVSALIAQLTVNDQAKVEKGIK